MACREWLGRPRQAGPSIPEWRHACHQLGQRLARQNRRANRDRKPRRSGPPWGEKDNTRSQRRPDTRQSVAAPTGVGKSWLAAALGRKACRDNRSVLYLRFPKLVTDLAQARADGRHARLLRSLGSVQLLILDDWGLEALDANTRKDLLEVLKDRYGRRSTVVTSQLPVEQWHDLIGNPTYADAILDRLVRNAHRITLTGDSIRKSRSKNPHKA